MKEEFEGRNSVTKIRRIIERQIEENVSDKM